ncbi:MFS transporter [Limnofasciculus baicalensis]|uniref:MFS transporter n=1 Tax=Limnofasciculus baicalensis BBK-W-15 TaxID=2699891 RepID=A0AAE3GMY9_9CYAN|nr:MFS transporter [Limnofasciculus baicalensis]MCP2727570.1 MFS transporter [Limnofasciculus baicalensis BBK-W-15]
MNPISSEESSFLHVIQDMRLFLFIWGGQLLAATGTLITRFSLNVWVYERTESAIQFALVSFFSTLPFILLAPVVGTITDRWNRRWIMVISDLCATLGILALGLLVLNRQLEPWHIYIFGAFEATCAAFQTTAFYASISLLVSKQNRGRANGLMSFLNGTSQILGPLLGVIFLNWIHVQGVLLLQLASLVIGILPLLMIAFPELKTEENAVKSSFMTEMIYGLQYLTAYPGLVGLLLISSFTFFQMGSINVITIPLVITVASHDLLGRILSCFGAGTVVGSLAVTFWGQPQHYMRVIYGCMVINGILLVFAGWSSSLLIFTISITLFSVIRPILYNTCQTIFQNKVDLNLQGRVFSLKSALDAMGVPAGFLMVGPLAEKVFEPLMTSDSLWSNRIGAFIGTGVGRGMGFLLILLGGISLLITLFASLYPRWRLLETELPDAVESFEPYRVESGVDESTSIDPASVTN